MQISSPSVEGELWAGKWKGAGVCLMPMPPGTKSVGYSCFRGDQVDNGSAVQVFQRADSRIGLMGAASGDADVVLFEGRGGETVEADVEKGYWYASFDEVPVRLKIRNRSGVTMPPVELAASNEAMAG